MLSDLDLFLQLYNRLGITLKVIRETEDRKFIRLQVGDEPNKKFSGYVCVYSEVAFDKDGKFVSQGFWQELPDIA